MAVRSRAPPALRTHPRNSRRRPARPYGRTLYGCATCPALRRRLRGLPPRLGSDETASVGGLGCLRKMEPLSVLAADRQELLRLRARLHALSHDVHAEIVSQRDDRLHQLQPPDVDFQSADERAVHFDGVDLEPVEMAERRVPGSEIVETPFNPERLRPLQRLLRSAN